MLDLAACDRAWGLIEPASEFVDKLGEIAILFWFRTER